MIAKFLSKKEKPQAYDRRETDKPPTQARVRKMYERPSSFTSLLPWLEYSAEQHTFLLDDGYSVAALFRVHTVGSEARSDEFMSALRDKVQVALTTLPEVMAEPWVCQMYLQDEASLGTQLDEIKAYVHPRAQGSELTGDYLEALSDHFDTISKKGGLFIDEEVTGNPWQGQIRTVRATLYRRRKPTAKHYSYLYTSPEDELKEAADKFLTSLSAAGVRVMRCGGKELYDWMVPWFNPSPTVTDGDTEALLKLSPYPGDEEMPFGYDFSESMVSGDAGIR